MPKSKKWIPVKTLLGKINVAFSKFGTIMKTSSGTIKLPDQTTKRRSA